jgi:squalene-hopene/tetraprenyl-beta-curcumene cyclase
VKVLCPILTFGVLGILVPPVLAGEVPTQDQVRKAVSRSLPYLEKEGVAWMKGRACISCHQVPSMIWALNEAARHDLPVDTARVFKEDFCQEATRQLTAEGFARHADALLKVAGKGGQGGAGGGENSQYTALLLAGAPEAVKDPAERGQALVAGLLKTQNKDGFWPAAGQFLAQQRPAAEAVEVVTLWTVLALTDVPNLSENGTKAVARARQWLQKSSRPAVSTEALMLRALLAGKDGDRVKRQELLAKLLKLQHEDGGWGWLMTRPTSDPFTTGLVLYGLRYQGHDGSDPAVQKAWKYLLQTQSKDGTWPMAMKTISATKKEKTRDGDAVCTCWGTSWAVIGLLQTLPE